MLKIIESRSLTNCDAGSIKLTCSDKESFEKAIDFLGKVFSQYNNKLHKVRAYALKINEGIENFNFFVQNFTQSVCPQCKDVCCIHKHGYYNYEDLIYLFAIGLRPPPFKFDRPELEPCQFLSEKGCIMERSVRPSGCNWYFCDPLLDCIEKSPDYHEFDNKFKEIAELWIMMVEEFFCTIKSL